MKKYLENQGFQVVDCETIQYGEKEWAIKKPEGNGEIMPVLVDFAHGKPMFKIHTDHHDSQVGTEKDTATNFKASRSNVETISQTISPKELFKDEDLYVVSTIDSANFAANQITTKMVMNFVFKYDKDLSVRRNKMMMGLVVNKLLLAYKNDKVNGRDFLEYLVMNCEPSLENLYVTIANVAKDHGFADVETMQKNQEKYLEDRSKEGVIQKEGGVIYQFGLGSMRKGSYDRYTPFDLNPDADFLVTGLGNPVGMVQASCNPYKADRELKGVDLGIIKDKVLLSFKPELDQVILPFKIIKKVAEKKATKDSVGFTERDMEVLYGESPSYDPKTKTVSAYDFLKANSGGHKCITNISAINYVYSGYDKPYTKDLPADATPIAFYEGSNSFIQDIKQKLLRFRKLSEKQIQAAINGMKREGIDVEALADPKQGRGTTELAKDMRDKFIELLNDYIKNPRPMNVNESSSIKGSIRKVLKENINQPFIFARKGDIYSTPGMKVKYLTPSSDEVGYLNILDFDNAYNYDYDIERFDKNKIKHCLTGCDDGFFNSSNAAYLHDLRVHDDFQGNGYSKKLMSKSHEIAKDNGFKYMTLITNCNNTAAQNLYQKLGYQKHQSDGKKDFYYKTL